MKIGLQINRFDYPDGEAKIGETVKNIAQAAEGNGFDSLWVMDHFFQIHYMGPPTDPMLEAYSLLGYLAGVTKTAMLGTMVTGVIYRQPALLVKAVTTLDILSGGRAYLGIGAGWFDYEANSLGFPDPLHSNRFERLEETLQIAKQMWSGEAKPFDGEQYQLKHALCVPQPIQKPHPPILIGGGGEQKTLRLVAKYADACNLFATAGDFDRKLDVLKRHCDEVGRDYHEIEKTVLVGQNINSAVKHAGEVVAKAEELAGKDVSHMILSVSKEADLKAYDGFAKTAQQIHKL